MSIREALTLFMRGKACDNVYVAPNIPTKKLANARAGYVVFDEPIIVLIDDTVFGSAKTGIAISESYIFAKGILENNVRFQLSRIGSIRFESNRWGALTIYIDDHEFVVLSGIDKSDHEFISVLIQTAVKAATDAAIATPKPQPLLRSLTTKASASLPVTPKAKPKAKPKEPAIECSDCVAELPPNAKFCLECGAKVFPKGLCRECNAKLPDKAKFCPECGTAAGQTSPKRAQPLINLDGLRRELTEWLAAAENEASIDSDGDLAVQLTAPAPSFAKDLRGWVGRYDIHISSEGVTRESNSDSAFFGRDDDFTVRSPYCRVGKLASAAYELSLKLQLYTLQELEVHEIELKEGKLAIPKLASTEVKIKSLSACRDNDGSYGIEYELEAYPEHVVHFEVLSKKPEQDAPAWAGLELDATHSGTNWLWEVEPGCKIYVCFGEYKPLVDAIQASFSDAFKSADDSIRASGSVASQTDVRGCILSALEGALSDFAKEPPTQAYSQGDCHFVWQIVLKDENGQDLTGATGDDFAVHCDVGLLEDVVVNEAESMSSVQNDVRERFNQFLADTNEEIVFAPSNAISPQHSEFFVYVCEVVDGGADVFRYYGKNFIFDRFIRDQAIGNELPEECGTRRLDTIDNDDLASESSAPVDVQLSDSGGNMKYNNIIYLSAAKAVNDEGFYTIDSYGEMPFILLTNFDSGEFARVALDKKDYIISVAETDDFYALIDEYARTESVNIFEKVKESDPGDLNYAFISSLIDGDFDDFEYENKPFKVKQFDLNSAISSNKIKNNSIGFWILQMQIEECEIGLDKCSVTLNGETYKTGGDIFNALYGNSDIRACFLR